MLVVMHYSWELSRLEERSRTLAEEVALLRHQLDELTDELTDQVASGSEVAARDDTDSGEC
jgi:hypothetical protein